MGKNFSYSAEWDWWLFKNKNPIAMHPNTKLFVSYMLRNLAEMGDVVLTRWNVEDMYNRIRKGNLALPVEMKK